MLYEITIYFLQYITAPAALLWIVRSVNLPLVSINKKLTFCILEFIIYLSDRYCSQCLSL